MLKWLKKVFIPHKHNDYKPHLFRKAGAILLFSLIVFLFVATISGPIVLNRFDLTALVLPKVLVDYANENRDIENFKHLAISPVLKRTPNSKPTIWRRKATLPTTVRKAKTPGIFLAKRATVLLMPEKI